MTQFAALSVSLIIEVPIVLFLLRQFSSLRFYSLIILAFLAYVVVLECMLLSYFLVFLLVLKMPLVLLSLWKITVYKVAQKQLLLEL